MSKLLPVGLVIFAGALCLQSKTSGQTAYTFTKLHQFGGGDGRIPIGGVIASGDTLYGTTWLGGDGGWGTVYKIHTDGSGYSLLKSFDQTNGGMPEAPLLLEGETLYGTATYGGAANTGVVFKVNTDGSGFSVLKSFSGLDGATPRGGLVLAGSTLYGTTCNGGIANYGTVFKLNTDGSGFSVLLQFTGNGTPNCGENPFCGLVLSSNTLYGTTYNGGSTSLPYDSVGTVFRINTDGTGFGIVKRFPAVSDGVILPQGALTLCGDTLYGTALGGFTYAGGIFKVNTDGTGYTLLKGFTGQDGFGPRSALVLLGNTLYGTTAGNYTYAPSTVYMMNTDGSGFSVLKYFAGDLSAPDGISLHAAPVLAGTMLFGTAEYGGARQEGVLFGLSLLEIVQPPQTQTAEIEGEAAFSVTAKGISPISYQWTYNGAALGPPSSSTRLTLAGLASSQSGAYAVVVSNLLGMVTSAPAFLNVIAPVPRRSVPTLTLSGSSGLQVNLDSTDLLPPARDWVPLDSVSLTGTPQFYHDLSVPLQPQRYYRVWTAEPPAGATAAMLGLVPAITLAGSVGDVLRLDYINRMGPTNAWATLDTVTLTNSSQYYFDFSALHQVPRLYRIVPVP